MTYKPDIFIYHDNCDDGFGAAWVAWDMCGDIDFRATNYGQPVPDKGIEGKHVMIADFSYSADVLHDLASRAASVIVLDHHKTAQAALADLPQATRPNCTGVANWMADQIAQGLPCLLVEFDMDRSGARMTWDFFFPTETPPRLVLAVEDRDLWRFALPDTRQISMYMKTIKKTFPAWHDAQLFLLEDPNAFFAVANPLYDFYQTQVAQIAETATLETVDGHAGVPVVHCPYAFVSDCCHRLLEQNQDAPFAMAVVKAHGATTFSMRSQDGRLDVSEIAKKYGGGGHRNAAGCRGLQ